MRRKVKKLDLKDPLSIKVMNLLVLRNGDDTLYDLCNYMGFDPASFRRKLERKEGWKEIEHINGILDYFGMPYEVVFRNGKYDSGKQIDELKKELERKDETIQTLREAMATVLGVDKSIISTQSKKSKEERIESVKQFIKQ